MIDLEEIIEKTKDLKLLYVEDNQDTREMTAMMLEDFFDTIILSIDGEEGLQKFKENDIDIVLTDINMPKLNGIELCKKIKEIDKDVPLLILSAHNEQIYYDDSEKIGIDGYLLKPIDIEQFSEVLHDVIMKMKNSTGKN